MKNEKLMSARGGETVYDNDSDVTYKIGYQVSCTNKELQKEIDRLTRRSTLFLYAHSYRYPFSY